MRPRWFLLIYALSGAAALVYEVAWTRLLTLSLGHGVAAASTVLAAFMGGLAVGAALAGPRSDRLGRAAAMRAYAGLEIAIAALALFMPLGLTLAEPLLRLAYADGSGSVAFPVLRLAVSLVLVALPAVAMGATFPLVARWYVPDAAAATRDAGALYAANTTGAALGALATGFVLLPSLGLRLTTWTGVAMNLIVAGVAWMLAQRAPDAEAAASIPEGPPLPAKKAGKPVKKAAAPPPRTPVTPQPLLAALAMAVSGFLSLALQVVWSRLLAQVLGPTTYAFSLVVAVFVTGLAVGAAGGRWLAARTRQPAAGLAATLALAVLAGAAAVWTIDDGLRTVATAVAATEATFASVLRTQVTLVATWLLPVAVALGCAFPFALRAGTGRDETLGADIGLIYALNTVGAIAGALAAGFVMIPQLGLHTSLRALGAGTALAALVVLAAGARGSARLLAGTLALAALVISVVLPEWNRELFASGAYKYASQFTGDGLDLSLQAGHLAYYREGATATVSVREAAGTTSLAIDGKVDASNAGDMLTQRLLAHVPLLLHPAPKQVAVLGLGSGVTLGAALTHGIDRADVLEISPEVVEASRFFDPENGSALRDPRTRVVLGDGRTHILLGRQQYDTIISEPSNPWMAGIASLFTREFFEAARDRLSPGGVLCQWAHTYDISGEDLRSLVATFADVFPDGTLWLVGEGDVLLIGSTAPLGPQVAALPSRLAARPEAAANLADVGVRDAFALVSQLVADGAGVRAFVGAKRLLQTDDHASVEFTGPRAVFSRGLADNAAALRALAAEHPVEAAVAARKSASPAAWRDRGWMLLEASSAREAWADFETAVRLDPRDPRALDGLIRSAAAAGRQGETLTALRAAAGPADHLEAQLALSRFLASTGGVEDAARLAFSVVEREPSSLPALEQLASVLADVGDKGRLAPVVARMRVVAPGADSTRYYTASLLFLEGRPDQALGEARALATANPGYARGQNLLGAALATLGRRDEAREAFQASLKADPRDPSTYTNLALLELEVGNQPAGLQRLAEALTLDPTAAAAREVYDRERARTPSH